ncbi:hypothetical protein [Prosthecobacter sp.]|uniref:type I-G CRISPR-associated protein, Cas3-extension family n=1 Tax=Prosthecobacter sp. TaxID=1965333 RepID=UPI00378526BA
MKWIPNGGTYYPVIELPADFDQETLLTTLHESLVSVAGHRTITFDKDLKVSQQTFKCLSMEMVNNYVEGSDAFGCSMVAAFGCDAVLNEEGQIEDTAFRTMSGAGHQHFLEFMNELAKQTNLEHLREALFGPWRYRDPSPIMRWDDADDRRYALRWDEPSKDPVRTVRGANRLAVAALPLFPTVPIKDGLATTSFKGSKSNDTFITWPLWSGWLTLDVVRSVLAIPGLLANNPDAIEFSARGITAMFRSQRITLGKYRNFTPAKSL